MQLITTASQLSIMSNTTMTPYYLLMVQLPLFILTVFFIFKLFSSLFSTNKATKSVASEPPQPSGRLPLLGHYHLIGWRRQAALTLSELADQSGPIFTMWFGHRRAVVVNSWKVAKECLTTHDRAMAGRPQVAAGKFMGYDHSMMVIAPYGPYWRHVRKLVTVGLLSAKHIELLKHVRAQEINIVVHQLYRISATNSSNPRRPVNLKKWLMDVTFNNLIMMVVGKRYYGGEGVEREAEVAKFIKAMERALFLTGNLIPSDGLPWLEWLDFGGHIRSMKKTMKELDSIASGWIEAHLRRRSELGNSGEERKTRDLMDLMLDTKGELPDIPTTCDTEMIIKATALTLVIAGTDTTYVTLTWAISLLMNNKQVLKKAQEELDQVVGINRNVEESDIPNLPYLQAVITETLRLYPSSPNSIPHETIEDTYISGYHIPAGTTIFFNILKIHRDPAVWEEPCKYKPERFLTSNLKGEVNVKKGQDFQLMPFGGGRRVCPGMTLALRVAQLSLARILHGFDLATEGDEMVDMTAGCGLTMPKVTPLDVILTPRLPSHLYQQ